MAIASHALDHISLSQQAAAIIDLLALAKTLSITPQLKSRQEELKCWVWQF
jgi:hypothetical protein